MEKANISITISFLILISVTLTNTQNDGIIITEQDYYGLQAFKHSISDPNGFLKTWNGTGIGACSGLWIGIKCVQGKVIAISLPWRGLSGQITEKINQLDALRKLSLHDNAISGRIPTSIGFLKDLRGVYLFNNRLSGSIPPSIGNCLVLQALDLSNNLFIGSIPLTISNSSKLFRLNLSYNNLSGLIPEEIGRLSSIRVLDLSHNNFVGEIPNSLERLVNLTTFDVSYNNLSGNVPLLLSKKFNVSSFVGNINLCRYSVLAHCNDSNIPSQFTASTSEHRRFSLKFIVMIASGAAIATLFVICSILLCYLLRQKKTIVSEKTTKELPVPEAKTETAEKSSGKLVHFNGVDAAFAADDLLCATAEILGKSTYGTVYKAMLEDGSEVAVKRLREKYTKSAKEFEMEVNMLGKVRHMNVLEVRAYYLGPKGEKLLVFDFMSKGSLASFLHARGPESTIDWRTRLNIAKGVACGLNYLHNTTNTIHGNLTSNNVLLDENTNPKIADFALHRLMTPAANSNAVAAATALGYRAPELHNMKKANAKTDIYGFGVVLLELITGKSPSGSMKDGVELAAWVKEVVKEEWSVEVFDVELVREAEKRDEMVEVLKLALECVDAGPGRRPNVDDVLKRLEGLGGSVGVGTSIEGGGSDG